jgi:phosphatidate cytidylyltransferase
MGEINKMKNKRVISALVAIPLLIFFVLMGGYFFKIGICSVTAIALYEYANAFRKSSTPVIAEVLTAAFIINTILVFTGYAQENLMPFIYGTTMVSMAVPVFIRRYDVTSSAVTILGFLYVICFFTLLIFIRDYDQGQYVIWLVFIISWFCDTFAYYAGRFFGKRKLCPEVSPKKTVEGSIGGVLGGTIGVILWWIITPVKGISWYEPIILGMVGTAVSQIGDLVASSIKRHVGIKDYGKIMPGHGGILDRFDSILYTAPLVYYYITMFMG